uniref:Uncharacterized protein n=1 Tax=Anopheles farauti TaxID=69004 RepID=A0A182QA23_9DIPT
MPPVVAFVCCCGVVVPAAANKFVVAPEDADVVVVGPEAAANRLPVVAAGAVDAGLMEPNVNGCTGWVVPPVGTAAVEALLGFVGAAAPANEPNVGNVVVGAADGALVVDAWFDAPNVNGVAAVGAFSADVVAAGAAALPKTNVPLGEVTAEVVAVLATGEVNTEPLPNTGIPVEVVDAGLFAAFVPKLNVGAGVGAAVVATVAATGVTVVVAVVKVTDGVAALLLLAVPTLLLNEPKVVPAAIGAVAPAVVVVAPPKENVAAPKGAGEKDIKLIGEPNPVAAAAASGLAFVAEPGFCCTGVPNVNVAAGDATAPAEVEAGFSGEVKPTVVLVGEDVTATGLALLFVPNENIGGAAFVVTGCGSVGFVSTVEVMCSICLAGSLALGVPSSTAACLSAVFVAGSGTNLPRPASLMGLFINAERLLLVTGVAGAGVLTGTDGAIDAATVTVAAGATDGALLGVSFDEASTVSLPNVNPVSSRSPLKHFSITVSLDGGGFLSGSREVLKPPEPAPDSEPSCGDFTFGLTNCTFPLPSPSSSSSPSLTMIRLEFAFGESVKPGAAALVTLSGTGELSAMLENFSGVVTGPSRVEDVLGNAPITGDDMLTKPTDGMTLKRRSTLGPTKRFGVCIATRLELSELSISLFFTHSRFFCACRSSPRPPKPSEPCSGGEEGLLPVACSRLRFVASPYVPIATAAVEDGGPLPAASSSDSSWHCFFIRSASSSSLLMRLREISFSASSTLRVGVASSSAHGVMTRFSTSVSPPSLASSTPPLCCAASPRPPNNVVESPFSVIEEGSSPLLVVGSSIELERSMLLRLFAELKLLLPMCVDSAIGGVLSVRLKAPPVKEFVLVGVPTVVCLMLLLLPLAADGCDDPSMTDFVTFPSASHPDPGRLPSNDRSRSNMS